MDSMQNILEYYDELFPVSSEQKMFYEEKVRVKVRENGDLNDDSEIIIRSLKNPTCIDVSNEDKTIKYTISKELGIEIVGDAKIRIPVSNTEEDYDLIIDEDAVNDEIEKNVKSVADYFVRLGGIYKDVYCGVGRNTKSVRCLYKSYNLALKAMKLQIRRNVPREAAVYKKMGVYRTLMAIDDMEIVKEYYNELFEPPVRYDELNKTSLVEFLKVYFEESGSAVNTAERMFLHRNTVNYKIHKIEEILDCNLSDFDTKVELYIALKLSELI